MASFAYTQSERLSCGNATEIPCLRLPARRSQLALTPTCHPIQQTSDRSPARTRTSRRPLSASFRLRRTRLLDKPYSEANYSRDTVSRLTGMQGCQKEASSPASASGRAVDRRRRRTSAGRRSQVWAGHLFLLNGAPVLTKEVSRNDSCQNRTSPPCTLES